MFCRCVVTVRGLRYSRWADLGIGQALCDQAGHLLLAGA
jgi:hypothetical protein